MRFGFVEDDGFVGRIGMGAACEGGSPGGYGGGWELGTWGRDNQVND